MQLIMNQIYPGCWQVRCDDVAELFGKEREAEAYYVRLHNRNSGDYWIIKGHGNWHVVDIARDRVRGVPYMTLAGAVYNVNKFRTSGVDEWS